MDFISNLLGKSLEIQVHKDWRDQHSFRHLKIVGHLYFFRKGALSRCSDVPSPSLIVKHTLVPASTWRVFSLHVRVVICKTALSVLVFVLAAMLAFKISYSLSMRWDRRAQLSPSICSSYSMRGNESMNKAFALPKYEVVISVLYSQCFWWKGGQTHRCRWCVPPFKGAFHYSEGTSKLLKKIPPLIRSVQPE